jgi:hypothetical protein
MVLIVCLLLILSRVDFVLCSILCDAIVARWYPPPSAHSHPSSPSVSARAFTGKSLADAARIERIASVMGVEPEAVAALLTRKLMPASAAASASAASAVHTPFPPPLSPAPSLTTPRTGHKPRIKQLSLKSAAPTSSPSSAFFKS